MAMDGDLLDFVHRFQAIQLRRDASDALIKDILLYSERIETSLREENQRLLRDLSDAQLDLAAATETRREQQKQLEQLKGHAEIMSQGYQHLEDQNPYVIVLIDGNSLLFKEHLVRQGFEGGREAADALRQALLEQCGEHAGKVEVVAKIWVDLYGLCRDMTCGGDIENVMQLRNFVLGFTHGKGLFDVVDVGCGREQTNAKIRETTAWNLRNLNCKQVILGISHDAGYAPFLDEIFLDASTKQRTTIIEGSPTVRELAATGVNILNLNETLFRSDKLVSKTPVLDPGPPIDFPPLPVPPYPAGSLSPPLTASPPASYARAIKNASPPPQITLPLQPRPVNVPVRSRASNQPPWNPGPRGLDPPILVSQAALNSIKKRKDSSKLCNSHFLRGSCSRGDACCFEHRYKPSSEEVKAIAFFARINPCISGQDCEFEDCIYGHHCPNVRDGQCTNAYCKFTAADHPPGTKLRVKLHDGY